MIDESAIRSQLGLFLDGDLSLDDFEDWLVQHSWNLHRDDSPEAFNLAHAIEHQIFLYDDGQLNEQEFRSELQPLARRYEVSIGLEEPLLRPHRRRSGSGLYRECVSI